MKYDLEQILVLIALAIVVLATGADMYEDWALGAGRGALLLDVLGNSFVAATLIYIFIQRPRATRKRNRQLERVVRSSHDDLIIWKAKAASLLEGLGAKINEQFDDWNLTRAEKEVALLLIKGYSSKLVADLRGTSEKTVRQQASSVYAKAKLEGRAELAAFFWKTCCFRKAWFGNHRLFRAY